MFPFTSNFSNVMDFMPAVNNSYIRLLHAVPNAPRVDIYANNKVLARNLAYRAFTQYMAVPQGTHTVRIYATGTTTNPVLTSTITIMPNTISTIAATGMLNNISLFEIPEPKLNITPGTLNIRFVHLSPNAPNVDLTLTNGRILFNNVSYKQIENYLPLRPGRYNFQLRQTGTNNVVLTVPNINFTPNRFYSIYAVGLAGANPPLQVLIPLDGNSYLRN